MNRRPYIHLGIAIAFLAAVAGGYVIWYQQLDTMRTRLVTLSDEIRTKTLDRERAANARTTLATLATDEAQLESYLVSTTDIVSFLEHIESLGSAFGTDVEVASVTDDGGTPRGHLTFSLSISGSFTGVMRTLGALEYGAYAVNVRNVNLDAAIGEGGTGWRATLTASADTRTDELVP